MRSLVAIALLGVSTAASAQQYYYPPNKMFNVNTVSSAAYARASYDRSEAFAMAEQIHRQVQAQLQQPAQVVYVDRPVSVQQPAQVVYVERPAPVQQVVRVEEEVSPRDEYIKECQRYGMSRSRCINIWDDKIPEYNEPKPVVKAAPKPEPVAKSTYKPARDEDIVIEYKEKPAPVVFKHEEPKVKPAPVPADVQLTAEQDRLTKMGIPIISGVRSAQKQEGLKDHQGPDGRWYTAAGNPVAERSHHLTGNAIDTGPLNASQRRLLAENGWFQPIPQQDPNHWEKINSTVVASR